MKTNPLHNRWQLLLMLLGMKERCLCKVCILYVVEHLFHVAFKSNNWMWRFGLITNA